MHHRHLDKLSVASLVCSWETRESLRSTATVSAARKVTKKSLAKAHKRAVSRAVAHALQARKEAEALRELAPPHNPLVEIEACMEFAVYDHQQATMMRKAEPPSTATGPLSDEELEELTHRGVLLDLSHVSFTALELPSVVESIKSVSEVSFVDFSGLETPKALSKQVHRHLLDLVTSCDILVELLLSDDCVLTPAQEESLHGAMTANAQKLITKEQVRRKRLAQKQERDRHRIPDDIMDFYHWENSNRLAFIHLQKKDFKHILHRAAREHEHIIMELQRATRHREQYERRVAVGVEHGKVRMVVWEDEEWVERWQLYIDEFLHREAAGRQTILSRVRAALEDFHVAKVEDFIVAKEALRSRLAFQRSQRSAFFADMRQFRRAIHILERVDWFALHLINARMKRQWDALMEERRKICEAEEAERHKEELRKEFAEQARRKQEEQETAKQQRQFQLGRDGIIVDEKTERDRISGDDFSDDHKVLGEYHAALVEASLKYNSLVSDYVAFEDAVVVGLPQISIADTSRETLCFYTGGDPIYVFGGARLHMSQRHCFYEGASEAHRPIEGSAPRYIAACSMLALQRARIPKSLVASEGLPVPPVVAEDPTDAVHRVTSRATHAAPSTANVTVSCAGPGSDSVDCMLPASLTRSGWVVSEAATNHTCSVRHEGPDPVPLTEVEAVVHSFQFFSRSAEEETRIVQVSVNVSLEFAVPPLRPADGLLPPFHVNGKNKWRSTLREVSLSGTLLVSGSSFACSAASAKINEYTNLDEGSSAFTAVSVADPTSVMLGTMRQKTESFIRSVTSDGNLSATADASGNQVMYKAIEIEFTSGYSIHDVVFVRPHGGITFDSSAKTLFFEGRQMGTIKEGRILTSSEVTQRMTRGLVSDSSRIVISLSEEGASNFVAIERLLLALGFANRHPAPVEGKRAVLVRLVDFSGSKQPAASDYTVHRARAPTTLSADKGKKTYCILGPQGLPSDKQHALEPVTFLFTGCSLKNADTNRFVGGYLELSCPAADPQLDFFGVASSSVENPCNVFSAIKTSSGSSGGGGSVTPRGRQQLAVSSMGDRVQVTGSGEIVFGGRTVATITRGNAVSPVSDMTTAGAGAAASPATAIGETFPPSSPNGAVVSPIGEDGGGQQQPVLRVEFATSGKTSIESVTALLHSIVFFSSRTSLPSAAASECPFPVTLSVALGPSSAKCDEDGNVVIDYDPPAPASSQSVPVTCTTSTSLILRPLMLVTRDKNPSTIVSYKEKMGLVRLPQQLECPSTIDELSNFVMEVRMFPPLVDDVITLNTHDLVLESTSQGGGFGGPAASLSPVDVGGLRVDVGGLPVNRRSRRATMVSGAAGERGGSVTSLAGAARKITGANSVVRKLGSMRQSATPSARSLDPFSSTPSGSNLPRPDSLSKIVKRVDDDVSDSDDEGRLEREDSGDKTSTFSPSDNGSFGSIADLQRMNSLGLNTQRSAEHNKNFDAIGDLHSAKANAEASQRLSRGMDSRFVFDSSHGVARLNVYTSKEKQLIGRLEYFSSDSRLVLQGKKAARKELNQILKAIAFGNCSECLAKTARNVRLFITDGAASFSQLSFLLSTEGSELGPKIEILQPRVPLRFGGSHSTTDVGVFRPAPLGRARLSFPESTLVAPTEITVSVDADSFGLLRLLTADEQRDQHDWAATDRLRLGFRYFQRMNLDLPRTFLLEAVALPSPNEDDELHSASSTSSSPPSGRRQHLGGNTPPGTEQLTSAMKTPRSARTTPRPSGSRRVSMSTPRTPRPVAIEKRPDQRYELWCSSSEASMRSPFALEKAFSSGSIDEDTMASSEQVMPREEVAKVLVTDNGRKMVVQLSVDISVQLATYVLACVAYEPASKSVGQHTLTIDVATESLKPTSSSVSVNVVPALLTSLVDTSSKDADGEIDDEPVMVPLNSLVSIPDEFVGFERYTVFSLSLSGYEAQDRIVIDSKKSSAQIKHKQKTLFINGTNCGKLFLSSHALRVESTALLRPNLLKDFVDSISLQFCPPQDGGFDIEKRSIAVTAGDTSDLPTTVSVEYKMKNRNANAKPMPTLELGEAAHEENSVFVSAEASPLDQTMSPNQKPKRRRSVELILVEDDSRNSNNKTKGDDNNPPEIIVVQGVTAASSAKADEEPPKVAASPSIASVPSLALSSTLPPTVPPEQKQAEAEEAAAGEGTSSTNQEPPAAVEQEKESDRRDDVDGDDVAVIG